MPTGDPRFPSQPLRVGASSLSAGEEAALRAILNLPAPTIGQPVTSTTASVKEDVGAGTTFITKDSGQREEFASGMKRDTREGKGRFDLLPTRALRRLAGVYERGAKKYGDSNWLKGAPFSRFMDSALRHATQALEGKQDEDHLAQAAWNLLAIIELQERINEGLLDPSLDDVYPKPNA